MLWFFFKKRGDAQTKYCLMFSQSANIWVYDIIEYSGINHTNFNHPKVSFSQVVVVLLSGVSDCNPGHFQFEEEKFHLWLYQALLSGKGIPTQTDYWLRDIVKIQWNSVDTENFGFSGYQHCKLNQRKWNYYQLKTSPWSIAMVTMMKSMFCATKADHSPCCLPAAFLHPMDPTLIIFWWEN